MAQVELSTKVIHTSHLHNSSHMVAEHGPDAPVPQMAEQLLEVPKIISQCRILQQTLDILVPQVVEEILEVIKVILQERISERIVEQIVDVSGSESLAATLASEVASKNSCAHVTADHEVSAKTSAEELKTLAEATQVLQSETCGADGQMYSLFQENSSVACQTSTDLKGFDMGTVVRQLAEQEHSAALAQRGSRVSAIMKFGAGADNDLFVKVKDLIMDLIRLQAEASHETNQKSHCDEEKLLSVVYKNAVDNRRAAWRVITSVEQKETSKGDEQLVSNAREYVEKVEGELQKIRDGILALMDKKLVPSASTDETKVSYYKMRSDYYRYFAEFATGETKSKAGEGACDACVEANKIAENDLAVTHPVRLAMALSSVVTQRQIPIDQTVQKTVETPQLQRTNRVIDGPVVQVEHLPQSQVAEETIEIPQLDAVEKIVETPEIQDRIQQRNVEQIVNIPVLPVEEELAEMSKAFSQNRARQRFGRQIVEPPAVSLTEKTVEMPDTRTQDKTQHVMNTHVQHVVNAVETEMSKIIKETLQRKKPIINEKINQVTKHVEIPQLQIVEKTTETSKIQTIQGTRTSESLGTAPVCQMAQAAHVEVKSRTRSRDCDNGRTAGTHEDMKEYSRSADRKKSPDEHIHRAKAQI